MENSSFHQVINELPETLRLPFMVWYKCGLFSRNKLKYYIPMTVFALCLASLVIIAMAQYPYIENDVSDFVRNLEEISAFIEVLGKVLVVTYRINDFVKLIEITKLFWNFSKCNEETAMKLSKIYRLIVRLQKVYLLFILMGGVPLMITPIIEKVPPLGVWTFNGHDRLAFFVTAEQLIVILCAGMLLWSLDCIYLGFCIEIVVQFKILCQYMEKLTAEGNTFDEMETNYLDKMKTCIRHHQLMLWFIKKFRYAFSLILLIQYLTAGPLICAELFAVFEGHSYEIRARHSFIFVAVTLQLSFYCISANYVADEALAVSNAVYCSKWYFHYFPSLKVPLLLMMQNAQRGITIRAGGLVAINTETFVNVLKVAWTACSLARGLRRN
ncbi:hypothetical protein ILUMI_19473 [Ignelater luminosus]|uniref:Odorant receptor n=1 Tax=Ignelater luminosus TaxID=2038154 RepID=A0A8K0CG77_IGNLU|nr:hypothetical protein ILUMI_19473 [Ignelater luminosus]